MDLSPEDREREYDFAGIPGGSTSIHHCVDLVTDQAANDTLADFARRRSGKR